LLTKSRAQSLRTYEYLNRDGDITYAKSEQYD
jgi:hypothetical protein